MELSCSCGSWCCGWGGWCSCCCCCWKLSYWSRYSSISKKTYSLLSCLVLTKDIKRSLCLFSDICFSEEPTKHDDESNLNTCLGTKYGESVSSRSLLSGMFRGIRQKTFSFWLHQPNGLPVFGNSCSGVNIANWRERVAGDTLDAGIATAFWWLLVSFSSCR